MGDKRGFPIATVAQLVERLGETSGLEVRVLSVALLEGNSVG